MSKNTIRSIKGTHDILPDQSWRWQQLENHVHDFMHRYGYREIRTPVFERTELFARGVGTDTDIVSKEMYTFRDMSNNSITLKPELTAPVIRSYLQHNLGRLTPLTKLYYIDHAFRQERPQAGRYRQFHQYGVEALGSPHPEIDAEIIAIAYFSLLELGLENLTIKLNSIGSRECRIAFRAALQHFLKPHLGDLSETSKSRFNTNPLRILDTKIPHEIEIVQGAPAMSDYLTAEDVQHYNQVKSHLNDLNIPFEEDNKLVRGLDYYTRTTFEIISPALGAQNSVCGGGRYDGLIETLGGKPTPGIGFAAGIERILMAAAVSQSEEPTVLVYLIVIDDDGRSTAFKLLHDLRDKGINADMDYLHRSMKSQLREANRLGAELVLIIGSEELKDGTVQFKNLKTGSQKAIPLDSVLAEISEKPD
ncbi:MAG: histidine--tRNA ligase [Candidatus Marinimicrobia bacterium]|nr:histidine--tRNA ligase [Candidatus Neomarinimicrobiota bacterium]